MTDPAPLTDEELAAKVLSGAQDRLRLMLQAPQPGPNDAALVLALVDQVQEATTRLIADLRAARAEVATLTLQLATMTADRDSWRRMAEIARLRNERFAREHRVDL